MNVNRKTKPKRLLSLLLVLCMVATLLPVMSMTAFAVAGDSADNPYIVSNFEQLKNALESSGPGEVKYIKTTTFTDEVETTDIGAYLPAIYVRGTKHLELSGTVEIKPKSNLVVYGYLMEIISGSTLNITGDGQLRCQFSGTGNQGHGVIRVRGTLNTNLGPTGEIAAIPGGNPRCAHAIESQESATMNLRGGKYVGLIEKGATLEYGLTAWPPAACAIWLQFSEKVTVEDVICTAINDEVNYSYDGSKTCGIQGNFYDESLTVISGTFDSDRVRKTRKAKYSNCLAWGSSATYDEATDITTVTAGTPVTDISITDLVEPVPGNEPNITATVSSTPSGKAKLYTVTWYNLANGGKAMAAGEKFEKNDKGYAAMITLYPDEGHRFKLDDIGRYAGTVTVNGESKIFRKYSTVAVKDGDDYKLCDNAISTTIFFDEKPTAVAPDITTSSLPAATQGEVYSQTITATGTAPITWAIEGSLPKGLTLNDNVISGIPTEVGTSTFTVKATNSAGSVSKALSITVNASLPVITTESLPDGFLNEAYSHTLTATGSEITWSIDPGVQLPEGLTLDPNTGVISGTPTTVTTHNNITVKATNSAGSATKNFSIKINDTTVYPVLTDIEVTVEAPTIGNSPWGTLPYSATGMTRQGCEVYKGLNCVSSAEMQAGEKFEVGTDYSAWYEFLTPGRVTLAAESALNVTVTGGVKYKIERVSDSRLRVYVNYPNDSLFKKVLDPNVTVTEPAAEATPEAPVAGENTTVESYTWSNHSDGSALATGEKFEAGKTYRLTITLKANADCKFDASGIGPNVEINGKNMVEDYWDTEKIICWRAFTVPEATTVIHAPIIVTDSLPNGTVGEYYSQNI